MRPSVQLLITAALLVVVGIFVPEGGLVKALVGIGAAVLLVDYWLAKQIAPLDIVRKIAPNLPVNRSSTVTLTVQHRHGRSLKLQLFDATPHAGVTVGLPVWLQLAPGEVVQVNYQFLPESRGDIEFGATTVMVRSPFGFWDRKIVSPSRETVRVYPDFAIITRYLTMVSDNQVSRLGIRLTQRRGEGLEFHQLREYRHGDSMRQVDWKATSRRRRLISREYQEERDQQILFLIDNGRRMRSRDGRLSHFDHALNAMLLLAYVALRQGDTVSMLTFGAHRRWVSSVRGVGAINILLNESYDLHTGPAAADYVAVAEEVMTRQRKRSLVVLLTDLREADDDLGSALRLLRQRHVVMLANLREAVLDDIHARTPESFEQALDVAGVSHYLAKRKEIHRLSREYAHVVLDTLPSELAIRVVNSYWQIKRSGAL